MMNAVRGLLTRAARPQMVLRQANMSLLRTPSLFVKQPGMTLFTVQRQIVPFPMAAQTQLGLLSPAVCRAFSMVFKKRPRSVKVNKYKLKTKKAMARRVRVVSSEAGDCDLGGFSPRPWL